MKRRLSRRKFIASAVISIAPSAFAYAAPGNGGLLSQDPMRRRITLRQVNGCKPDRFRPLIVATSFLQTGLLELDFEWQALLCSAASVGEGNRWLLGPSLSMTSRSNSAHR
jgi:hypothetical protein